MLRPTLLSHSPALESDCLRAPPSMCVCVGGMQVSIGAYGHKRGRLNPVVLELQAILNQQTQVPSKKSTNG